MLVEVDVWVAMSVTALSVYLDISPTWLSLNNPFSHHFCKSKKEQWNLWNCVYRLFHRCVRQVSTWA